MPSSGTEGLKRGLKVRRNTQVKSQGWQCTGGTQAFWSPPDASIPNAISDKTGHLTSAHTNTKLRSEEGWGDQWAIQTCQLVKEETATKLEGQSLTLGTNMMATSSPLQFLHTYTHKSKYWSNVVAHSFNLSPHVAEASVSQGLSPVWSTGEFQASQGRVRSYL